MYHDKVQVLKFDILDSSEVWFRVKHEQSNQIVPNIHVQILQRT